MVSGTPEQAAGPPSRRTGMYGKQGLAQHPLQLVDREDGSPS